MLLKYCEHCGAKLKEEGLNVKEVIQDLTTTHHMSEDQAIDYYIKHILAPELYVYDPTMLEDLKTKVKTKINEPEKTQEEIYQFNIKRFETALDRIFKDYRYYDHQYDTIERQIEDIKRYENLYDTDIFNKLIDLKKKFSKMEEGRDQSKEVLKLLKSYYAKYKATHRLKYLPKLLDKLV